MSDLLFGIRHMEWVIHRSLAVFGGSPSGIYARFRGRHGELFIVFEPMAEELLEDIERGHVSGSRLLESAWREFRYRLDRRYGDPFAFWPQDIGSGRWAA